MTYKFLEVNLLIIHFQFIFHYFGKLIHYQIRLDRLQRILLFLKLVLSFLKFYPMIFHLFIHFQLKFLSLLII